MDKESVILSLVEAAQKEANEPFVAGESVIRYAGPQVDANAMVRFLKVALDSITSGQLAAGPNVREFESTMARFFGVTGSVFVNSGSSANLLSIASLCAAGRLRPGDEVLTTATTFPTTINPLILYQLKPVLVDVVLPSYTMNLEQLGNAITSSTKAIMIPHLNGSANNMAVVMEMAERNGIQVIEDACDAIGSKFQGRYLGTWGDIGTMSFYAAHHITTGEGGAVLSSDQDLIDRTISLRDWGRSVTNDENMQDGLREPLTQRVSKELPSDYEARFTYTSVGYNLKPLDMQGALGLTQLPCIPGFTKSRADNHRAIYEGLSSYERFLVLPAALPEAEVSWFVFPIVVREDAPFRRADITAYLEERKIETRPILAGNIRRQPAYSNVDLQIRGSLTASDAITERGFFVGTWPGLGVQQVEYMVSIIQSFLERY